MPPRATWKGQLKLSLVSFPIRLHNAISSTNRVSLNQLHAQCHRRLKQQMICPEHGAVERSDIVKGYEFEKNNYVVIEDEDLDKIRLESVKTIELTQFIDADELQPIYLNTPYYVAPDGPVAEEAFRVIREALRRSHKIGIGKVVMSGREYVVALDVLDKGFVLNTLRSAAEVHKPAAYFEDIRDGEIADDQLQLAQTLIDSKAAPLDEAKFVDRYQDALLELVKAKIAGAEPVAAPEEEAEKVINLMDALRQSVASLPKKPPAKSVKQAKKKTAKAKRA